MSFDLVIDEQTVDGQEARVSKTSVCGSWGAVAGNLRYFADRSGTPRASVEGTQIPAGLVRQNAVRGPEDVVHDHSHQRDALLRQTRVTYFGFELERDETVLDEFPPELADRARWVYADALAREEARHAAVKRNRDAILLVRESYRRSGGIIPRLGLAELRQLYIAQLAHATSVRECRAAQLRLDLSAWVPADVMVQLNALPDVVQVREIAIKLEYDVEEHDAAVVGVVRMVLPERMARTLAREELPTLDRPIRFLVHRGQRGSVRAATLGELQDVLDQPWSPDEGPSKRREREDSWRTKQHNKRGDRSTASRDRDKRSSRGARVDPRRRRS